MQSAAGMPGPNFPMSNPFWPQMGSGMSGGSQGPRPPLYPGASSNGSFDPVSAAYYANLGNQQMAAAMAAAAVRPAPISDAINIAWESLSQMTCL